MRGSRGTLFALPVFAAAVLVALCGCASTRMTREEAVQATEEAKKLLAGGFAEEAYLLLEPVVEAFPLEPVPNILFQDAAGGAGHSTAVLERYENLAAILPQSAPAQLLFARLLGPGERRLKIARRSVWLDPGSRDAHHVLVGTILALNLLVEERAALSTAADRFPDSSFFMHAAADAAAAAGDVEESLKKYRAALKLEPVIRTGKSVSEIVFRLGRRRFEQNDVAGARACFEFALELGHGDSPDARLGIANCDIREERFAEARKTIEAVIKEFPEHSDAVANLALLDALSGNYKSALEAYERSLEINPDNILARRNMARVLLELGRCSDAIREAGTVLERDRGDAETYPILIEGYLALGMNVEAEFMLEQFLKYRPDAAKSAAGRYRRKIDVAKQESGKDAAQERARLEKMLEDADPAKRAVAFVNLNRLMRNAGFPHLEKLLSSRYADIRSRAAKNIGLLGNVRRAVALLQLLNDPEESVRREAVKALRKLSEKNFGFDPAKPGDAQAQPVEKWRAWCKEAGE